MRKKQLTKIAGSELALYCSATKADFYYCVHTSEFGKTAIIDLNLTKRMPWLRVERPAIKMHYADPRKQSKSAS